MAYKKVESIAELKEICRDERKEFFISLAGGMARSSKTITYDSEERMFEILNEIDDTDQLLTEDELLDEAETNIGQAILAGTFYQY